jgi:CDP-2,3-bis-(O-geranylgeranyl)-sn-glycerol synthase
MALGLDQIPESLLPLLAVAGEFGLSWTTIGLITIGFIVVELALSRVLYRLGVRNRPY